jgi:membrane-bound lytic murein transglycosylase F
MLVRSSKSCYLVSPWQFVLIFVLSFGLIIPVIATDTKIVTDIKEERIVSLADDFEGIKDRGTLRIIVPARLPNGFGLPRSESPILKQLALVTNFAHSLNLHPEIVPITSFNKLLPSIINGDGDVVVANLTVTEKRKKIMAFSTPVAHIKQVVLVPKSDAKTSITKDLEDKRLLLNSASSYWARGLDFKSRYPSIQLIDQSPDITDEQALDLIATKQFDATIRDSNIAEMYLSYRDDIRVAFNASG